MYGLLGEVEHHMLVQALSLRWSQIMTSPLFSCFCVPGGPSEGGASGSGTSTALLFPQLSGLDVTISLVDDEEQNQVGIFFRIRNYIFSLLKGPKLEIFVAKFFTQSRTVWVDDLGTEIYLYVFLRLGPFI
jgi:hypothetical protein